MLHGSKPPWAHHSSTSPRLASNVRRCLRFSFEPSNLRHSDSLTAIKRKLCFCMSRRRKATEPSSMAGAALSSPSSGLTTDKGVSMSIWMYASVDVRFRSAATSVKRPMLVRWSGCTVPSTKDLRTVVTSDSRCSEHLLAVLRFCLYNSTRACTLSAGIRILLYMSLHSASKAKWHSYIIQSASVPTCGACSNCLKTKANNSWLYDCKMHIIQATSHKSSTLKPAFAPPSLNLPRMSRLMAWHSVSCCTLHLAKARSSRSISAGRSSRIREQTT
mmetsp:Transcript_17364/g.45042  ORF Transcript_17364/g.45042 Transcript_17364/m.45042 type:complete len:274 (-) Transcript_17364:688-1509(-)